LCPRRGYLPPEYIHYGRISAKNDIFSLGVVMIKIIAGPRGHTKSDEMPPQEFIDQVRNKQQYCGFILSEQ
jgi:serine/threonine protein kinase